MLHGHFVSKAIALAIAAPMVVGCGGCGSGDDGADDDAPDARPQADADPGDEYDQLAAIIEEEMAELDVPGVAVAIVRDGEVAWSRAFGVVMQGSADPLTTDTVFLQGVTSEVLTALGVLRLVDQGAVDLDDPITDYIPEFTLSRKSELASQITVRHLLTQASGLPDGTLEGKPGAPDSDLEAYLTSSEFADKLSLVFPPGELYYHSKWASGLAALVIERADPGPDRYFTEFMQEEVFEPLGTERASFDQDWIRDSFDEFTEVAWGADVGDTPKTPFPQAAPWHKPCCVGYGSVLDMAELARFLAAGDTNVLSEELRAEMIAPQQDLEVHFDRLQMGLGAFVSDGYLSETAYTLLDYDFPTVSRFSFCMNGNSSNVVVVPDREFAFVFAANRSPAPFNRSVTAAFELLLGEPSRLPVDAPEDPDALSDYAGTYLADTGFATGSGEVTVAVAPPTEAGQLAIDVTYPPAYQTVQMVAFAPGNFTWPAPRETLPLYPIDALTFIRNEDNQVEYLRSWSWGFVATKQ